MILLEIQRQMRRAVTLPLTREFGMRRKMPDGKRMNEEAAAFIKPNRQLTAFERLEIYNRQYWFRIISAFEEDFPGLAAVVGPKQFNALTLAYLTENPSTSFTLRNLGRNLEDWLTKNTRWGGPRHSIVLDVVRLEWAYTEAFDAGQESPVSLADLVQLGPDSRLSLQPHVVLLHLTYPVDDLVIAAHRQQGREETASNAVTRVKALRTGRYVASMQPQELYIAVHRFEHSVYYKRLDPSAYRLLSALKADERLDAALEAAFRNDSDTAPEHQPILVKEWFSTWAELGWFCQHRVQRASRRKRKETRS